jgi:hypothetical protein
LVSLQFLVADIVHADSEVFRNMYNYQYQTYLGTGVRGDKANLVKGRD